MNSQILNSRILLVDDEAEQTQFLEFALRLAGYKRILSLNDPRRVLSSLIEFQPDLIVLDLMMPHFDGFRLLNLIHRQIGKTAYLPILVVTAETGIESRIRALSSGAADYILKPFLPDEICLRVRNILRVRQLNERLKEENLILGEEIKEKRQELADTQLDLKQAQIEITLRLAKAAEHHDNDTGQHTQRVGVICTLLAQSLGLPEEQTTLIRQASPLHDVGKIGVPDEILLKPGRLTPYEHEVMERHCEIGSDLLSGGKSDLVQLAEQIALNHHERWDGSGYPNRLKGEEIPIESRILAVADVFDALCHDRPYKPAWPIKQAVAEIREQQGRHFDPSVVDAFLALPLPNLV